MFKNLKYTLLTLALVLAFLSASLAQQPNSSPSQKPEPESVTERGFKNKVFEIKYRDPSSLARVLSNLTSGFNGSSVYPSAEFKTITVRDFPENLATMEEALKRLDTPASPRPNIELNMHVLIASNAAGAGTDVPAELKDVVTQLRATLNYRNYEVATSIVQRLAETPGGLRGSGTAELPSSTPSVPSSAIPYQYFINKVSLVQNATGGMTVQIAEFTFMTTAKEIAQVQTALNLRDGEKVVVGTATISNRALVIVLTAKLIK